MLARFAFPPCVPQEKHCTVDSLSQPQPRSNPLTNPHRHQFPLKPLLFEAALFFQQREVGP